MKTLIQVKVECPLATVMTIENFLEHVMNNLLTPYDGFGYYHDGVKETNERVYYSASNIIMRMDKYPYICWYNK